MADLNVVNEITQISPEVTPGSSVNPDTILTSLGIGPLMGRGDGRMFRPQGVKLNTQSVPTGLRFVESSGQGIGTYDELIYLLLSAIKVVTPTADGTNGKKWTFSPSRAANDTRQTYTVERGIPAGRGQKATFLHAIQFGFEMSKEVFNVTSGWRGQQLQDDVTLTGGASELTTKIIRPLLLDVGIADTQAALPSLPTGALARAFKVSLEYGNITDILGRMFSTDNSFVATPELAPDIRLKLTVDADDAGMAYLAKLVSGATQFIRVTAVGDAIAGAMASAYKFNLDFAGKVIKHPTPEEMNGSRVMTWEFENVYDTTWGKSIEIYLINEVASA